MTQVTYLGKQSEEKKNPIEFLYYLSPKRQINEAERKPNHFKNVLVLSDNYNGTGFTAFFAYGDNDSWGSIYLGHLNDGVV